MKRKFIASFVVSVVTLSSCNSAENGGKDKFVNSSSEKKEEEKNLQNKDQEKDKEKDKPVQPEMISGAFLTCGFDENDLSTGGCAVQDSGGKKLDISKIETDKSWSFYKWENNKEVVLGSSDVEFEKLPATEKWHIKFKIKHEETVAASEKYFAVQFNFVYRWNSANGSSVKGTNTLDTDKSKFNNLGAALHNLDPKKYINKLFLWPNPEVRISGALSWSDKNANFLSTRFATKHEFLPINFLQNNTLKIDPDWLTAVLNADNKSRLESGDDVVTASLPYTYEFGKGDCFEAMHVTANNNTAVHGRVVEYSNFLFALIKRQKAYLPATENYQATATLHVIPKASAAAIGLTADVLKLESTSYPCK